MSREEAIKNCCALAFAALVIDFIFHSKMFEWVAVTLLGITLFSNKLPQLIAQIWYGFANVLGKINSTIILTAIFYLVVTPTALLYRWFNKKTFNHFFKKKNASYFIDFQRAYTSEHFEKPW